MQVYKLFFQVLRKQKGQIIMYLVIFLSVALAAASQGGKTGEAAFSPTTYKFAVMDADNSEISREMKKSISRTKKKSFRMRFTTGVYRVFFGFQAVFLNLI